MAQKTALLLGQARLPVLHGELQRLGRRRGADGRLACGGNYPDNADSRMSYGPFSLEDATAAELSFRLWLDVSSELEWTISACTPQTTDPN